MAKFSLKKFVMKTLTAMRDAGEDEYKVMQSWFEVSEGEDTDETEEIPEETGTTEI